MAKKTTAELQSLLARNQHGAIGSLNGTIGHHRAELMDRYMGEQYGDEVKDRSSIVMTDVRDTIEGIKPELMDIFFGGDKVVEFSPRGADDVDAAEQETEVLNYVVNQMNDGFMVFYCWFHDALVYKNGYIKRYWDERVHTRVEEYDDLTEEEVGGILLNLEKTGSEIEVVETWGGMTEEGMEPIGFKVKVTDSKQKYIIDNVPPEEVFVAPQWTKLNFDGCPYVAHRSPKTVSDLIEMGFNRKQVEALPTHDARLDSEEAENRFSGERFQESDLQNQPDDSQREVLVYENYILADMDGDGISELLQVYTGGTSGEILKRNGKLAIEEVDSCPLNVLCPLPIPHKHYGLSIAELVQDLQRLRTVLTRQLVDNTIYGNNPDMVVDEDTMTESTVEDLSITGTGRVIRIPGGPASLANLPPANTTQASLMGIEYVDRLREARTGVTRYSQGLDADSLNKNDSGAKVDTIMTAAQKKVLLIARIFAETGVRRLFLDIHKDMRRGPLKEIAIKLRDKWVPVNPRTWVDRSDMSVSVGLGTGDRQLQYSRLGGILQQQKEGLAIGMVTPKNIHHTLTKMVELSGFKDTTSFFPDPDQMQRPEPEEPQPDPAMMLAQVEMKKAEMQRETKMAELEIKKMDVQLKAQEAQTKRLEVLMKDDRERDLAGAKIEADEAARMNAPVDGEALTHD